MATWGERLGQAIVDAGLSKSEFGRRVGRSYQTVVRWTRHGRTPDAEARRRIGDLGGVFAQLAAELPADDRWPVDFDGRVKQAVVEVLREVQFPRLESIEARAVDLETATKGIQDSLVDLLGNVRANTERIGEIEDVLVRVARMLDEQAPPTAQRG